MKFTSQGHKATDDDFFTQLYCKYKHIMLNIAQRYASDLSESEDIVHDSLVKLLEKESVLCQLNKPRLVAYLIATTRNTAINQIKKHKNITEHCESLNQDNLLEFPEPIPALDELIIGHEDYKTFCRLWEMVPEDDKLVLEGKYILGLSDEDLAQQCGCNPNSIRMKLTRARRNTFKLFHQQNFSMLDIPRRVEYLEKN